MGRFVVLEHTWDGVHWDWMLERDGMLRTWAVDVPAWDGRVCPARPLADHRSKYLDYEGPVSGDRGVVRRVDGGAYEAIAWGADRVVARLRGNRLVGQLDLWSESPRLEEASSRPRIWYLRLEKVD